jgi:phosphatidate phosphatase LPIN
MPGSFEEEPGGYFPVSFRREEEPETEGDMYAEPEGEEEEDNFDDDLLATGEMQNVPF